MNKKFKDTGTIVKKIGTNRYKVLKDTGELIIKTMETIKVNQEDVEYRCIPKQILGYDTSIIP